jgi:hypothetical protein
MKTLAIEQNAEIVQCIGMTGVCRQDLFIGLTGRYRTPCALVRKGLRKQFRTVVVR